MKYLEKKFHQIIFSEQVVFQELFRALISLFGMEKT